MSLACTRSRHSGERGLEANHAERGLLELHVLFHRRVGRVIGGDGVDGPVGQRLAQRRDVAVVRRGGLHLRVDVS